MSVPSFALDYAPGQMLVKFKPDIVVIKEKGGVGVFPLEQAQIGSSSINSLNAKHNARQIRSFMKKERRIKKLRSGKEVELPDLSQIYLVTFPADADMMSIIEEYQRDPSVEFAGPNHIRKMLATPNDPKYRPGPNTDPNQWGLYKIGLCSIESGISGWNIETGTNEVRVAVLDTGVDYTHEDLQVNVASLEGYNFVSNKSDPMDDVGHGTHCAGIIGADTDNGIGIAGVNWHCTIIPIKFMDSGGGTVADEIRGIIWAVSKEADVLSMSFGAGGTDAFELAALSYAATSDCVLVAAAGNSGSQIPIYPGGYNIVLSVAATGTNDAKAWYSNYGTWVKVSAPGGDQNASHYHGILSTLPPFVTDNPGPNIYDYWEGTSMATPLVAGLAALIRAKYPNMSAEAVAQKIISTADNINGNNPLAYKNKLGSGRINAIAALSTLYANISSPAADSTVDAGPVEIIGSATGEGFDHWTVSFGSGTAPSSWTTIETSSTQEINSLLATLDASTMNNTYVTVKLSVFGLASAKTETQVTFHVGAITPPVPTPHLANVQFGPNPFNPGKGPIMLMYDLAANADIDIYFYDMSGTLICRKSYPYGGSGGRQGINRVYWDGNSAFGETVANGVYLFRIVSDGKVIEKGKIIVLK